MAVPLDHPRRLAWQQIPAAQTPAHGDLQAALSQLILGAPVWALAWA
jgi:hypothetical protein